MSDGSIVFDTKIDNKGFEKGAENIKTKVKGVVNSISNMTKSTEKAYNGISSSQMSLMNRIDKTKGKIDELKTKIETLENAKVETDEFKEIQTQIANANKELQKLRDKKAKKEAVGVDKNSKSWKSLIADIQAVKRVLAEAKAEKKQLEASGQAYKVAGPTPQTQAMKIQVGDEQQKLDEGGGGLAVGTVQNRILVVLARVLAEAGEAAHRVLHALKLGLGLKATPTAQGDGDITRLLHERP